MNLIPLAYQKNQRYKQLLGYSVACCTLMGLIGVSVTCLMPLEILTLEREVEHIQKAEVFKLIEERDRLQFEREHLVEEVNLLNEQYSHMQSEKQTFKDVLGDLLMPPLGFSNIVEIVFDSDVQSWYVIGKHSELKVLIEYEKMLKQKYGIDQVILQIEPKDKGWYFSLRLSLGEGSKDDSDI